MMAKEKNAKILTFLLRAILLYAKFDSIIYYRKSRQHKQKS